MHKCTRQWARFLLLAAAPLPGMAHAQRAAENAVANADDAFGANVGLEQTGIYSETDTRGFSPIKAGNARIDGLYYDPVGILSTRIRGATTMRVGFASEGFPFHAPTGIVDYQVRPFPEELGASLSKTFMPYGGWLDELDLRIPVLKDHVGITGGVVSAELRNTDGSYNRSWGMAVRPFFRFGGIEVVPFANAGKYPGIVTHPLIVVSDNYLPAMPAKRQRFYQTWAKGTQKSRHYGVTIKAAIADGLSLRAGLFRGELPKTGSYSEIFQITAPLVTASGAVDQAIHRVIADPHLDTHSTSGEALLTYGFGVGKVQHRFYVGYRARDRYTETGGSIRASSPAPITFGLPDAQMAALAIPDTDNVNRGRVKQSSLMFGYSLKVGGLGSFNLGLQKAHYRAVLRHSLLPNSAAPAAIDREADDPWVYNASLSIEAARNLSFYLGNEKGLEDSGLAPENAANRNDQLAAARTTQYEAGVRWKFRNGQLVVGAFQIAKPYFTFDAQSVFTRQGTVRHRGIEASLSGHFGKRFNLVAGAVMLQPRVLGPAAARGNRPAGTPSINARIDASYRTDVLGGLTPTFSLTYTGSRAVGPAPIATPQAGQLMLPGVATVDLGLRQQFHVGKIPASFRAVVQNVFDKGAWKVVAANTLTVDERRRFTLALVADF